MSRKTVLALSLLILSPLIIYFLWPSDENRIKKLFREGANAIQEEDIKGVMSFISYNYMDDRGFSYITVKEGLGRVFEQMSGIKIDYQIRNILIKDDKATADLELRIIATDGQDTGYVSGDASKPSSMKFFFEKERTRWLVSKTEGSPVSFQ
jgi:hypothetical protein